MAQPPERPLLSVAEASALAGFGKSWGYALLAAGELPGAVKLGGRWYVRRRVFAAFLSGEATPAGEPPAQPLLRAV